MGSKKTKILVSGLALTLLFGQGVAKAEAKEHKYHSKSKFVDKNKNGLPDKWEKKYKLKGKNVAKADHDKDGLHNLLEYKLNLNPKSPDTDKNGVLDGQEDKDKDGLSNLSEIELGTNPTNPDTNNNKVLDGSEQNKDGVQYKNKIREFELEIETDDQEYKAKYKFKKGKASVKVEDESISKELVLSFVNKLESSPILSEEEILALIENEFELGDNYKLEIEVEYLNGKEIEIEKEKLVDDDDDNQYNDDDDDQGEDED